VGVVGWIVLPAFLGGWVWFGAVAVMGLAVLLEADRIRALAGIPLVPFLGTVLGLGAILGASHPEAVAVLVPASLLAFPSLFLLLRPPWTKAPPLVGTTMGLSFPAYGLASLLALGLGADGLKHVFFLFAVTEIQDSVALLAGKFWGKTPIFPRLSPGKTWTGTLAGGSGALGAALLTLWVAPLRPVGATLVLGLAVGLAGLAGDLCASAMKRRAGVKDFGASVPTMGGVLDVYDSLLFAAPFYLIFVWWGL
jgi:phosphatidate cytidylyltransferase